MTDPAAGFRKGIFLLGLPWGEGGEIIKRPALALSEPDANGDIEWLFLTAAPGGAALALGDADFSEGGLPRKGHVRVENPFTIHKDAVLSRFGKLTDKAFARILKVAALRKVRTFSEVSHAANLPGQRH